MTALDHAQITVPRGAEESARAFYCGVLGLPEIAKPDALAGRGGFWLQVGDRQVHVGTEDGVDRNATKAHLAYRVRDLPAWQRHLAAHGFAIDDSVPIPGFRRCELRDPFGNRLELIEPLP
ncbi:MAG TPA: VOC family protein [Thermoanaerobaculia bacterium]